MFTVSTNGQRPKRIEKLDYTPRKPNRSLTICENKKHEEDQKKPQKTKTRSTLQVCLNKDTYFKIDPSGDIHVKCTNKWK